MSSTENDVKAPVTKTCLIVIDGWGIAPPSPGNAITQAKTPNMTALEKNGLAAFVEAHGLAVGLPKGVMGNSEVGHLTIGAGRVNFQDLERINLAIEDGSLVNNPEFVAACNHARSNTNSIHFIGLVSDGGVHSHIEHLKNLLKGAKQHGIKHAYLHFIGDGRDTAPTSSRKYLAEIQEFMKSIEYGQVVSMIGRYYAMDRDNRWDRIEIAYNAFVTGSAVVNGNDIVTRVTANGLDEAVKAKYDAKETDEFLKPIVVVDETNTPVGRIQDNDTVLLFNFRSDRMREIASVLGMNEYPFEKKKEEAGNANSGAAEESKSVTAVVKRSGLSVTTMTQYDARHTMPVMFKPVNMRDGLSEWISKKGYKQYHTAETEKNAHVTFFFNGGIDKPFPGEDRRTMPSPKHVATYDLKPEMNAEGVADSVIEAMKKGCYEFVMCNFAPPDMVGHTGVLNATIKAVEATDVAIGRIMEACRELDYTLVLTSDHGNAEQMLSPTGTPFTAHTTNLVPLFIQLGSTVKTRTLRYVD